MVCIVYRVQCTPYGVHCILYSINHIVYSIDHSYDLMKIKLKIINYITIVIHSSVYYIVVCT